MIPPKSFFFFFFLSRRKSFSKVCLKERQEEETKDPVWIIEVYKNSNLHIPQNLLRHITVYEQYTRPSKHGGSWTHTQTHWTERYDDVFLHRLRAMCFIAVDRWWWTTERLWIHDTCIIRFRIRFFALCMDAALIRQSCLPVRTFL